jgi:hypothetical protein
MEKAQDLSCCSEHLLMITGIADNDRFQGALICSLLSQCDPVEHFIFSSSFFDIYY